MFNKIQKLYPNAILRKKEPDLIHSNRFHWFYDFSKTQWLGIPRVEIQEKELSLLKALFEYYKPANRSENLQKWFSFLYSNGEVPIPVDKTSRYRTILFSCSAGEWEKRDFEQALKGFFSKDMMILWEGSSRGIIIEKEYDTPLEEEDFLSMSNTLESDIFVKTSFFIGKFLELGEKMAKIFLIERTLFQNALSLIPSSRIFSFEKIFPILLTSKIPDSLFEVLDVQIIEGIKDDPELLATIEAFIENNMNATLTAKKLYIHRNTLQYRLEKFSEKTGVNLKDFHSAFTVYTACLIQKQNS